MQHHFRHAAREKHAHGGMSDRAVGQHIDQTHHLLVDLRPVVHAGPLEPGAKGDSRKVQQQVRRSPESGMHHHRVAQGTVGEDIADGDSGLAL